jgi:hypothetical protein
MPKYPTPWKRTTMRGCGPACTRMDLLVESRSIAPGDLETRHVAPRGSLPTWVERCGQEN